MKQPISRRLRLRSFIAVNPLTDECLRLMLLGVEEAHHQAMIAALDREAFGACVSDNADYLCHQEMEIRDFYAEENRA